MENSEPVVEEESQILTDNFSEALSHLIRKQTKKLVHHEKALLNGVHPEEIHEMRIAVRRLKLLVKLYPVKKKAKLCRHIKQELRSLGKVLGPLRDIDIVIEKAAKYKEKLGDRDSADMDVLLSELTHERELLSNQVESYLKEPAYTQLKDDLNRLASFYSQLHETNDKLLKLSFILPAIIFKHYGQLRESGALCHENHDSLDQFHKLRIKAKILRYSLEFFQPYFGPTSTDLIATTKRLQEHLGTVQDFLVTTGLIKKYLETGSITQGSVNPGVSYENIRPVFIKFLAYCQSNISLNLRKFPTLWRVVDGKTFSRRLANILGNI